MWRFMHVPFFVQSWHEGFVGTFEGLGSCQRCKWHWWYCLMHILGLRDCWSGLGNNGITSEEIFNSFALNTFSCAFSFFLFCCVSSSYHIFRLLQVIWWLKLWIRKDIMHLPSLFHLQANFCKYSCLLLQCLSQWFQRFVTYYLIIY